MSEPSEKKTKVAGDVFLVFGSTGWLGGLLCQYIEKRGLKLHRATSRLENQADMAKELDEVNPNYVLNLAGLTGRPNVDWCEDHKPEVLRVNVIGTMALADLCFQRNIHLTIFGTGCIYHYDKDRPQGSGKFTERDPPNFFGSYYSTTKGMVQQMLETYNNVLLLRVRMPISDDRNPRNFITKIHGYHRIVNIPNSMTILYDLLPLSIVMCRRHLTGTYNFTNPGKVSHNEVLDLYKQYIDPSFTYQNFTIEEQAKVLKAARSNNELDTTKLEQALPDLTIPPVKDSLHKVYQRMKDNIANDRFMELPDDFPLV